MDLPYLVLTIFLICQVTAVSVLCMPVPSNDIRGAINRFMTSLWDQKAVEYGVLGMLVVNVIFGAQVGHALANPLYDMGFWSHDMGVSCEYKQDLYLAERNAYITGANLFLFFVLVIGKTFF